MTALSTDRRRRYDAPAQLSDQAAAEQLKELTKATLALTRRIFGGRDVAPNNPETQKSLKAATRNLDEVVRIMGPAPGVSFKELKDLSGKFERFKPAAAIAPPEALAGTNSAIGEHLTGLVKRGVLTDSAKLLADLGWTRQSLSKALKAHRIFFVEWAGTRYYPAFFADQKYERGHLEAVSKALGPLPGGSKLQFFLSHRGSLGGKSVLEALSRGQKDKVIAAAQAFAEG